MNLLNLLAGSVTVLLAKHARYGCLNSVGVFESLATKRFGSRAQHRCPSYFVSIVNLMANEAACFFVAWYLEVASMRTVLPMLIFPSVTVSFSGHTFTITPSSSVHRRPQYWETTLFEVGIRDRSRCTMKNELFSDNNADPGVEYASTTRFWLDVPRHHQKCSLLHIIFL